MTIKNTVNVSTPESSPVLTLKKGVLVHNDILDKTEFEKYMKKRLSQEGIIHKIQTRLGIIKRAIAKKDIRQAYKSWESFERAILENKDYGVELVAILNIANEDTDNKKYTYKYGKEENVLNKAGVLSQLDKISQTLFTENLQVQVNNHLGQLIGEVNSTVMPDWFIDKILNLPDDDDDRTSEVKKRAAIAKGVQNRMDTYRTVLYASSDEWRGHVADAFMNHVAHMHIQLLAGLIPEPDGTEGLFPHTVFEEEKNNIFELLMASKNDTPWFTGGDVIAKYKDQIFNIQVKTSKKEDLPRRVGSGEGLKTAKLINLIKAVEDSLKLENNQKIDQLITTLYEGLETSGYVEKINSEIEKTVDKTASAVWSKNGLKK